MCFFFYLKEDGSICQVNPNNFMVHFVGRHFFHLHTFENSLKSLLKRQVLTDSFYSAFFFSNNDPSFMFLFGKGKTLNCNSAGKRAIYWH